MYRLVHQNIPRGFCQDSVSNWKLKKKYISGLYYLSKPSSYIFNNDATKLYGKAKAKFLPYYNIQLLF